MLPSTNSAPAAIVVKRTPALKNLESWKEDEPCLTARTLHQNCVPVLAGCIAGARTTQRAPAKVTRLLLRRTHKSQTLGSQRCRTRCLQRRRGIERTPSSAPARKGRLMRFAESVQRFQNPLSLSAVQNTRGCDPCQANDQQFRVGPNTAENHYDSEQRIDASVVHFDNCIGQAETKEGWQSHGARRCFMA